MARKDIEKKNQQLFFDTPQHRAFRDDPFDRLLFMASLDGFPATARSPLLLHLPFWERIGALGALGELDDDLGRLQQGYRFGARSDRLGPGEGLSLQALAGMEVLLNWAGAGWRERWDQALAENSRRSIFNFALQVVPVALLGAHSKKLAPDELEALRGIGRAKLVDVHGLTHERIDELSKDAVMCEAISRLLHGGAKDPTALTAFLRMEAFAAANAPYGAIGGCGVMDDVAHEIERAKLVELVDVDLHALTTERIDELSKDPVMCEAIVRLLHGWGKDSTALTGLWSMPDVAHEKRPPEWAKALERMRELICAIEDHSGRGRHLPEMLANETAVERSLYLALQCSGDWLPQLRSALLSATATSESPESDPAWQGAPFEGDFDLSASSVAFSVGDDGAGGKARRAKPTRPGKGARGVALRGFLGDADAIWKWRNPLSALLSTEAVDGVSPGPLALSLEDAKIFSEHVGNAAAAGVCAMAKKPSERKAIGSALAEMASCGFGGIGRAQTLWDFFPDLPHCQENFMGDPKAQKLAWFAEALAAEPMGPLALAFGKLGGIDAEEPLGLVGEAKRALGERNLSNAAWKALAANPSLRSLIITAVSASGAAAAARGSSKARSPKKEAAHVMAQADAAGSSCRARIVAAIASERVDHPLDACISVLSWSASMGISQEIQAAMLSMLERNPKMRMLFAGIMPELPKMEAVDTAGSLSQCESVIGSLREDATAARARAPAIFKSMAAKMARLGAKSSFAQAEEALAQDFANMLDCAKGMPPGFWSQLSAADPYSHARRMHEDWIHALNQKEMDENPEAFKPWASLVDADRSGRVSCVEMLCGRDLFLEGKAMSHCVSSYADACRSGGARVVSMRLDGSRCSTLELAPVNKRGERISSLDFSSISQRGSVAKWAIVQHRGKCNAPVTHREILEFSLAIEAGASTAFHAETEKMIQSREADLAESLAKRRADGDGLDVKANAGASKRRR